MTKKYLSSTLDSIGPFSRNHNICYRKQVRVDEIFVHENFTTTGSKANDIALLRLGENQDRICTQKVILSFEPLLCLQRKGLIFPLSRRPAYPLRITIQKEVLAMSMVRRQFCFLWQGENCI